MRVFILGFCALLLIGPAWSAAQSPLGEVAKQEEERRRNLKGESRVYTNKDLPNVPSPLGQRASPVPPSPAPASDTTVADPANEPAADEAAAVEGTEAPRDREYWSGRIAELREALARDRVYADALQSRINALTTDFVNRDDPLQRAAIAADRDRAMAELEKLRTQLVADEEAIDTLQDEARRAGVPAGWLR